MRSISIYTITRNQNISSLSKLERQLSDREYFLKIREWELESMRALVRQLELYMQKVYSLRFFYSYQIPRLGKEFDLLQIKDDQIINIELKAESYRMRQSCQTAYPKPLLPFRSWSCHTVLYLYQQPKPPCETYQP